MGQPAGYFVDPEALAAYGGAVPGLAAQLGDTGTGTLSEATSVAADCFGRIGEEVGLSAAFQRAAQAEVQALAAAAASLASLAAAVRDANTGYAQQESDHADQINRSGLV